MGLAPLYMFVPPPHPLCDLPYNIPRKINVAPFCICTVCECTCKVSVTSGAAGLGADYASRRLVHEHAPLSLRPLLAERAAEHERGVPGASCYVILAPPRTYVHDPARGANLPMRNSAAHAAGASRASNGPDLWRCGEKRSGWGGGTTHHTRVAIQTVVPFPAGQNWARE